MAEEIQLLACGYSAECSARQCKARATTLARYTDAYGRALRQRELCERHAAWLRTNRPNVFDLRNGIVCRQNLSDKLVIDLREGLVHLS